MTNQFVGSFTMVLHTETRNAYGGWEVQEVFFTYKRVIGINIFVGIGSYSNNMAEMKSLRLFLHLTISEGVQ